MKIIYFDICAIPLFLIILFIFPKINPGRQTAIRASEIVHSRTFAVEAHIEAILDRAIREDHVEM